MDMCISQNRAHTAKTYIRCSENINTYTYTYTRTRTHTHTHTHISSVPTTSYSLPVEAKEEYKREAMKMMKILSK